MDFAFEMMKFGFKMMNSVFKMMGFCIKGDPSDCDPAHPAHISSVCEYHLPRRIADTLNDTLGERFAGVGHVNPPFSLDSAPFYSMFLHFHSI